MQSVACVLACTAVLSLPAAAVGSPRVATVRGSVDVEAGQTAAATRRCPGTGLAAAAHATALDGAALVRRSAPSGIGGWRFTVSGDGGTGSARLALRCVRVVAPRGSKNVRTGVFTGRSRVTVPARGSRLTRVSCPRGYLPTGYGLDRGDSAAARRLALVSAVPAGRSWAFRLENGGSAALPGSVRVRCVTARARGSRAGRAISESLSISRPSFIDRVTGNRTLTHSCPAGRASLAAGFSVAARDDASVPLASPTGRRSGAWLATNPSGPPQRVRTYLTCLSLRTSFR